MCGIAGFLLHDAPAHESMLRAMCDRVRHRGPDDEGFYVNGACGLGMRRLSIIDLAGGHQPMSNEDGSVWVVFNGEIYNFRALQAELKADGHQLKTRSDCEVIVHLYEQYGVDGISRLRGMFAFAIWDTRRRELLLARDRFGKKPLYYAGLPGGLYFASELKSLKAAGVAGELDHDALRLYFQLSYVPDPFTPFRAVRKVEPGSWLVCEASGRIRHGRYWRLPPPTEQAPAGLTEADTCDRLRTKIDEAVRLRMDADVPLGAFLSGGLDSSTVVASMARQSSEPVATFVAGFDDAAFNERPHAAAVAAMYRTNHQELLVQEDAVGLVSRLATHFDEPFGDASAIPTFMISEAAARHVKVVLTGDGGDELFGGYQNFLDVQRHRVFDRVPLAVRHLVSRLADWLPYGARGRNYLRMASRASALERYFESNYAPYFLRRELLSPDWMLPADLGFLTGTLHACLLPVGADILSQALYFEATASLTGDMLVKVDRMSMANSLEARSPLLDHELAELAASIPNGWKVRDGEGKYILRKAVADRLPPVVRHRKKQGFGVPLAAWFRTSLRGFLWDHLTDASFLDRGIVSPAFVRRLLEEHASGRRDNQHWLWSLLAFRLWLQTLPQST